MFLPNMRPAKFWPQHNFEGLQTNQSHLIFQGCASIVIMVTSILMYIRGTHTQQFCEPDGTYLHSATQIYYQ